MQRLIFCPNNEMLEEAEEISKKNRLPIVVGENYYTLQVKFDRSIVSTICIPEKKDLLFNEVVQAGMHQIIVYNDEFVTSDQISIEIEALDTFVIYKEKYKSRYAAICIKPGNYNGKVMIGSKIEKVFNFVVN